MPAACRLPSAPRAETSFLQWNASVPNRCSSGNASCSSDEMWSVPKEGIHHLGYFDQTHFIQDFRKQGGDDAGRYRRRITREA